MQKAIFAILAAAVLGGIVSGGIAAADGPQVEQAVFFVQ